MLIGYPQLVYSQSIPNFNLSINNSSVQGYCAPQDIEIPVTWPSSNDSTTEYIFILHDDIEPFDPEIDPASFSLYETFSFFHSDSLPENIIISFNSSSCNANNSSYALTYYVKDLTGPGDFSSQYGFEVGSTNGFTVNGKPEASFSSQEIDCGLYTFTNTSISGEIVINNLCEDSPTSDIEWVINADPSEYTILDGGSLGEGLDPASDVLNVQFVPGNYDIMLLTENVSCNDSTSITICIEDYDFNLDDLSFSFPQQVCVNDSIFIENSIDSIEFVCNSTNDIWYDWDLTLIDECVIDNDFNLPELSGSNPSFSIANPGIYEIRFTSIDPCINPPIDTTHIFTVVGYPLIDATTFDYNQNCDLSADLSIDFDSCFSEPPYDSNWAIISGGTGFFDDNTVFVENSSDYTIEYTLSGACGVDTSYFDMSISDTLSLEIVNDTIVCEGDNILIDPIILGGVPEYSYLWEGENGFLQTSLQLNIPNISDNQEISLQVTDSNNPNCIVNDSISITVIPDPGYTLVSPIFKCQGDTIEISFEEEVLPGHIVSWENDVNSSVFTYFENQDSLINVTVTVESGCSFDYSTQVDALSDDEGFINFPDTIPFCELGLNPLVDSINHPTINSDGVWFGDSVVGPNINGDYFFSSESYGSFNVYYSKENVQGCLVTDSAIVIVSSNPSTEFNVNNESICAPGESYIVLEQSVFIDNPLDTDYTLTIIAGEDGIETEINFNHDSLITGMVGSNFRIQADTLFFNLNQSSCDFNYDNNPEISSSYNGAYYLLLEANNVCTDSPVDTDKKIFSSSQPIADFTYDDPDDCHTDIIYEFINSSIGEINIVGSCFSPNINWQISGVEDVDWQVQSSSELGDTLNSGSDILEVMFMNTGSYDVTLITSNSCQSDTITKEVLIEESPLADIGVEVINDNLCAPDSAFVFLSNETYLNPDTTSYLISIYGGEGNLIDTQIYIQSTLPDQTQGILLDSINSSSCNFTYNDSLYNGSYKVEIEAINICDSSSTVTTKFYYANPSIPQFNINSELECANGFYTFTDITVDSLTNFDNCNNEPTLYWELSGTEGVDWTIDGSLILGDSSIPGDSILGIQFLNPGIYSMTLISNSCSVESFSESFCVTLPLNFIEDDQLISFNDTACLNTPYTIQNLISENQACGLNFNWSISSSDVTCFNNQSNDFELINATSAIPSISFFNPGVFDVSCTIISDCSDTLVISKNVNVLEPPALSSFEVIYEAVCDSNHISLNLVIDSCVSGLYNTVWNTNFNETFESINDTSVEIIFSDYINNEIQYTLQNYCGTLNSEYVHDFVPTINSFGPDINLCQSDYILDLENDSLDGSWLLNNELLPTDSNGTYFFTADQIGFYTLLYSYTNTNDCEIVESLNVNVQAIPEFNVDISLTECTFDEVAFDISLPGFDLVPGINFFWTSSPQPETFVIPPIDENPIQGYISANEIGEYTNYFYYQSLDDETCYSEDSMNFIANGADFSILADSILCDGDTVNLGLDIVSVSPNGPYSISWEPSGQTFQPIIVSPSTSTTYVCSITDANNCVSTDTLIVDVLCSSESLSDFEPFVVENETQNLFPDNPLFENILYEGCIGAKITFFRPDCIDIENEITIDYKISKNDTVLGPNFESDEDFSISPPTDQGQIFIPSNSSSVTIDITPINDYNPDLPDTISFGISQIEYHQLLPECFKVPDSTVYVEFIIVDQPDFELDISANPSYSDCPGQEIEITAYPFGGVGSEMIEQESTSIISAYTYEWEHIGSSQTQFMNPYDTTTYSVTVTDVCGSMQQASVDVPVTQYDPLSANVDMAYVCEDTLTQICVVCEGGDGNYSYSWSNGYSTECIEVFHQLDPYTVTVTDGCNTEVNADGYVDFGQPEPPYFEFLPIPHIENGIEFYNYTPSLLYHSYLWDFGDSFGSDHIHPSHTFPDEGSYTVTLTVSDSLYPDCKLDYSSFVNVESPFSLWVPNSFTPNNDGVNDVFKPIVIGVDYYELIISNRWGEIIFTTSDINESWDGFTDGKISPIGVYKCEVIYSKYDDIMNLSHIGNINLIR